MDQKFKFSPSVFGSAGTVEQSSYALKAVSKGSTSVGIVASEGVVIGTATRKTSELMEPRGMPHVAPINTMIGMAYSGLSGDFRILKNHAQRCSIQNNLSNGSAVKVKEVAHCMVILMQEYTQMASARPFGVSLLIAGCDKGVPHLYDCSANGTHSNRKAIALGRNAGICTSFLENRFTESLKIEDAIDTALLALKKGYEEKEAELKDGDDDDEEEDPMPTEVIQIGIAYPEGFECMDSNTVDEFYATSTYLD
ncbi:proteasome subunit alpha type-2-like [Drosophila pseudoobscura]|uniref:Proteasome subunit alpha type-2-like n=1 Tax=Drosophila pseudoobscura pseudoobscura TaxID=46245 RepID=A0A6I8UXZ7_DROPS|nr:proteasome subunit alpha type-2 [Drosophila pseudoobscura]